MYGEWTPPRRFPRGIPISAHHTSQVNVIQLTASAVKAYKIQWSRNRNGDVRSMMNERQDDGLQYEYMQG